MTQEEKLLLKDLCARLPYGVKVKCEKYPFPVTVLYAGNIDEVKFKETGGIEHICLIKPYLRPMSSMTEEEKEKLQLLHDIICDENYKDGYSPAAWNAIVEWEDYCNSNYLDYRGLIPIGLALEAKEGMYKIN